MTLEGPLGSTGKGDLFTLVCAIAFAGQIVTLGHYSEKFSFEVLTIVQVATSAALALAGMRTSWLPARVAQASHPAIIAAVGAAFAISFDSISTALIFSAVHGTLFAALLGAVFTLGMAGTDQLNGWWIARLVRSADQRAAVASRYMSVAIAGLCFVLALYGLLKYALPQLSAPADAWAPAIGAATCAFLLLVYLWTARALGSRP